MLASLIIKECIWQGLTTLRMMARPGWPKSVMPQSYPCFALRAHYLPLRPAPQMMMQACVCEEWTSIYRISCLKMITVFSNIHKIQQWSRRFIPENTTHHWWWSVSHLKQELGNPMPLELYSMFQLSRIGVNVKPLLQMKEGVQAALFPKHFTRIFAIYKQCRMSTYKIARIQFFLKHNFIIYWTTRLTFIEW